MLKLFMRVTLFLALAACDRQGAGPRAQPKRVPVACTTQPQSTLVHVALARGFFAAEGLDVAPVILSHGRAALQEVLEGRCRFATVAETPVMFSALRGEDTRVIAQIEASTMNNAVVARRSAGIAGAGDLKGKRVAFTAGTTSEFFLDTLLTVLGLTRQDVVPVPCRPEDMVAALAERKVDAVCTWNYPLTLARRALGPDAVVIHDREVYTEFFTIASLRSFLEQDPETARSFLRALLRAEADVARDPEGAQAIVAKATGTPPDLVREVWSAFRYRVVLEQGLLIALEDETRWAMKNGLAPRGPMPDYRRVLQGDVLKAVAPPAARI